MACVRKRRGKWVADYRDHTGKRHWETFDTKRAAEAELAKHVTAIDAGKYTPPNDRRTVKDAYDSWWKLAVTGSDNKTGAALRPTTQAVYSMTWRTQLEERWGSRKLHTIGSEEIATWRQELLNGAEDRKKVGPRTVISAMQVLGALFRHARRFKWIASNPLEDVNRPKYRPKVRAFTVGEIELILENADADARLFIETAASTGLRFGELAGLKWSDFDGAAVRVSRQFTHGAWSELKTENARRRVPLPAWLVVKLKARHEAIAGNVVRLDGQDDRLIFPGPAGTPIDYSNWRHRVWLPLLKKTGPDEEHPKRVAVDGTPHMLRHSFATALIQSGENAKTVATLIGHHSVAFTMDQYADAWPETLTDAAEKVAGVLFNRAVAIR